jgi:hypothetical protein
MISLLWPLTDEFITATTRGVKNYEHEKVTYVDAVFF